jgi:trehalose-phosphatase
MSEYSFEAIIFDMDGVITKTALVHAHAWKRTFDEYMQRRKVEHGEPFREFTHDGDYLPFVDGRPRYKGVKSFLQSRGIDIPYGDLSDPPDKETICGLGNRKNELFREVLEEDGVERYDPMIKFIEEAKKRNIKVGVASSSKNCQVILEKANALDLFETRVDGVVSEELGLEGKPEPDIFLTATRNLGADPAKTIVVEDAVSGVAAGRNGAFGLVLGLARKDNVDALLSNGADIVMKDLSNMNIDWLEKWFRRKPQHLLFRWDEIDNLTNVQLWEFNDDVPIFLNPHYLRPGRDIFEKKKTIFFLDYDGTLTPIVERPEDAVISDDMRDTVTRLAEKFQVSVVSGRFREDVENLLGIKGLLYAGSHGFDIKGEGLELVHPKAKEVIPVVEKVIETLTESLGNIEGLIIEKKKFSVAVHYRMVDEEKYLEKIRQEVDAAAANNPVLRLMKGKKVFELLPAIEWDKGKAIRWILEAMKIDWKDANIIYIGDDVTDEFAFRMIRTRGTGIVVLDEKNVSAADFRLESTEEVKEFFEKVIKEIS